MTVDVTRAVCPSCGGFEVYTVHIRSDFHDQLVCESCRGCSEGLQDSPVGSYHPRHSFPPATISPKAAGIGNGPAATGIPNPVLRPGRRTPRKIY